MRWKIVSVFTSIIHESYPDLEYTGMVEEIPSFLNQEGITGMGVNDHGYIA